MHTLSFNAPLMAKSHYFNNMPHPRFSKRVQYYNKNTISNRRVVDWHGNHDKELFLETS